MKKIKVALTLTAFTFGIGATTLSSANFAVNGIFGYTSVGSCVARVETVQSNCSANYTGQQCTVLIEGSIGTGPPQEAPAYSLQVNQYSCALPLRRP